MSFELLCLIFTFAYGCCIGSFLNVVIYRMPRDKSLITPPSACPSCDSRIRFYDNIPLISWILLGGKCRNCKAAISSRYFVVELLTGLLFAGVFALYFIYGIRRFEIGGSSGLDAFLRGGWYLYVIHIFMLSAFVAASGIDLELWVIPLSVCWVVTVVAVAASGFSVYVIKPAVIWTYHLFPSASATTGALAVGAAVGLVLGLLGLCTGVIKRSYESDESVPTDNPTEGAKDTANQAQDAGDEENFNDRAEVSKELLFLLPIVACSALAFMITRVSQPVGQWWGSFSQLPVVTGLLGSLWGYFAGCAVVWTTRILGTWAFGKEAMGLGDVHLMGAAGAVIGPVFVVIAFFIAPFFGLGWALFQMIFKKTRQIPYGPFLSLGVFAVMILHDWLRMYLSNLYLVY